MDSASAPLKSTATPPVVTPQQAKLPGVRNLRSKFESGSGSDAAGAGSGSGSSASASNASTPSSISRPDSPAGGGPSSSASDAPLQRGRVRSASGTVNPVTGLYSSGSLQALLAQDAAAANSEANPSAQPSAASPSKPPLPVAPVSSPSMLGRSQSGRIGSPAAPGLARPAMPSSPKPTPQFGSKPSTLARTGSSTAVPTIPSATGTSSTSSPSSAVASSEGSSAPRPAAAASPSHAPAAVVAAPQEKPEAKPLAPTSDSTHATFVSRINQNNALYSDAEREIMAALDMFDTKPTPPAASPTPIVPAVATLASSAAMEVAPISAPESVATAPTVSEPVAVSVVAETPVADSQASAKPAAVEDIATTAALGDILASVEMFLATHTPPATAAASPATTTTTTAPQPASSVSTAPPPATVSPTPQSQMAVAVKIAALEPAVAVMSPPAQTATRTEVTTTQSGISSVAVATATLRAAATPAAPIPNSVPAALPKAVAGSSTLARQPSKIVRALTPAALRSELLHVATCQSQQAAHQAFAALGTKSVDQEFSAVQPLFPSSSLYTATLQQNKQPALLHRIAIGLLSPSQGSLLAEDLARYRSFHHYALAPISDAFFDQANNDLILVSTPVFAETLEAWLSAPANRTDMLQLKSIVYQLLQGLSSLHERSTSFGCFTAAHVRLGTQKDPSGSIPALLAARMPVLWGIALGDQLGSLRTCQAQHFVVPPEVEKFERLSGDPWYATAYAADAWCLGALLHVAVFQTTPVFDGDSQLPTLPRQKGGDPQLRSLIRALLHKDVWKRLSCRAALVHGYFVDDESLGTDLEEEKPSSSSSSGSSSSHVSGGNGGNGTLANPLLNKAKTATGPAGSAPSSPIKAKGTLARSNSSLSRNVLPSAMAAAQHHLAIGDQGSSAGLWMERLYVRSFAEKGVSRTTLVVDVKYQESIPHFPQSTHWSPSERLIRTTLTCFASLFEADLAKKLVFRVDRKLLLSSEEFYPILFGLIMQCATAQSVSRSAHQSTISSTDSSHRSLRLFEWASTVADQDVTLLPVPTGLEIRFGTPAGATPDALIETHEAFGRLLIKCVLDGCRVTLPLSSAVFKFLLNAPAATRDIASYTGKLTLDDMTTSGLGEEARELVQALIDSRRPELEALRRGFAISNVFHHLTSLSSFELQSLCCGVSDSVEDLRAWLSNHLDFVGFEASSHSPAWLKHTVLHRMDGRSIRRLLYLCTGQCGIYLLRLAKQPVEGELPAIESGTLETRIVVSPAPAGLSYPRLLFKLQRIELGLFDTKDQLGKEFVEALRVAHQS
ncbi:hypothetical protein CAOG_03868 [Capsaspora owczarzaki ATCC 30864]|uniref:Protein kinase domain-containing protein n=1 Tax=Capsaspora owczarzaki (strain ATCC 30864) TaxID=595528 RepID=A0A0D2WQ52_CAPO3|nr:hypothetical protein CAOG_03868 [Capsaspora owczarzaki ATCC 30864]KJE93003.1 hypothetical protein CAOG_003868 [Capsaspora owczarzaki ATCC 30864]|eukprot:XP_004363596.2 hypothetical protein CAOG_03868 [Capsaspora owczarzaki ATCC 30864]